MIARPAPPAAARRRRPTPGARRLLLAAAGLAALAASACAHEPPRSAAAPVTPPTAAELPPPDAIPGQFAVRQKLTATSAKGGGSFEAVLQKTPGTLTLVGLTPYGSRAFLLQQTKGEVQFTKFIPRDVPFAPTFMLLDIHRVLDQWLGAPLASGERSAQIGDETITERWQNGNLLERTFTSATANPPGTITVSYAGHAAGAPLAAYITLRNDRLGYRIEIDTVPLQ